MEYINGFGSYLYYIITSQSVYNVFLFVCNLLLSIYPTLYKPHLVRMSLCPSHIRNAKASHSLHRRGVTETPVFM